MGVFRYSRGGNLLRRPSAVVTATSSHVSFPLTQIYDDDPSTVHRFASDASPLDYLADIGQVPTNGGFETAFVGGLPAADWSKSAGATLVRNTTSPRTGAACLEVQGGSANYSIFKFTVRPGEQFRLTVYSRNGGSGASKAILRNLYTGYELWGNGNWIPPNNNEFHGNGTAAYVSTPTPLNVTTESPVGGPPTMTLQLELYGNDLSNPLYDDVEILFGANAVAVFGHNHGGITDDSSLSPGPILSWSDNGSAYTVAKYLAATRPVYYGILSSVLYHRYWRLRLNPLRAFGDTPWTGELWLGNLVAATKGPAMGWKLRARYLQQRTAGLGGVTRQVFSLGEFEQHEIELPFNLESATQLLELYAGMFQATRGGAEPLVVVPNDSYPFALHGRLRSDIEMEFREQPTHGTAIRVEGGLLPLVTTV